MVTTAIINRKMYRVNEVLCKHNENICELIGIRSIQFTVIKRANLYFSRMHCAQKSLKTGYLLKNRDTAGINLIGDFVPS